MPVSARRSSFWASGVMRGVGGFGAQDADRVRVEGDCDGLHAEGVGSGFDAVYDPAVAAVDAVEVADGSDGGGLRDFGQGVEDVHAISPGAMSNSSWRPS